MALFKAAFIVFLEKAKEKKEKRMQRSTQRNCFFEQNTEHQKDSRTAVFPLKYKEPLWHTQQYNTGIELKHVYQ